MKSQIKKLIIKPLRDVKRALFGRAAISLAKQPIFIVGFSTWKQYLRKYFSDNELIFLPKDISEGEFNLRFKRAILDRKNSTHVFIWGFKAPDFILTFLRDNQISTKFVEDGFVRSVQLGATKAPPMSLCLDAKTPYFDATKASELEDLLSNFDFSQDPALLKRAKDGIKLLCDSGVSKYNNSSPVSIEKLYGAKKGKRVLVLGQVEDDASIMFGCEKRLSNNDVVRLAAKENPGAQIIYKPHPDVLNGHRPYQSNPKDVANICTLLTKDIPLANALETIDHAYTITSLAGFEALLRGIKVTTLGCPFYAGWGLTDDRQPNSRRTRKLKLEELFAVSYLAYPKYYEPESGKTVSFEEVIDVIKMSRNDDFPGSESVAGVAGSGPSLGYDFNVDDTFSRFEEQIAISPTAHGLYFKMAQSFFDNMEYEKCLELIDNAISFDALPEYLKLKAGALQKLGRFDSEIDNCYIQAIRNSDGIIQDSIVYQYFSYKWESEPINDLLINKLRSYIDAAPVSRRASKSYGKLKLLLASYFAESGQINQALTLRGEGKKSKAVDVNLMYLRYWAKKRGESNAMSTFEYESFSKLLSFRGRFKSLVLEAGGSVCIVGNSPNLIGKGLGEEIDSHKLVVRFNSYDTSYPYCQDFGIKTDVWVRMPFHPYVKNRPDPAHKLIIFTGSNRYNRPYTEWHGLFELINDGFPVEFFDPVLFYELQAKIKSPPTAGMMLCYMLYKIIGPLKPDNYYGFSFAEDVIDSDVYHYSDSSAKAGKRHNWDAEAEVFKSLISRDDNSASQKASLILTGSKHHNAELDLVQKVSLPDFRTTNNTDFDYDVVISTSPGLNDYCILGQCADYISAKSAEDYIEYVESGGTRGVLTKALADLSTTSCIVGFGRGRTGQAAERAANLLNIDFRLVEYGFISSMHLPSEKQFNFSLVLDDVGIFYDTTRPSRIENILNSSEEILSEQSIVRATAVMAKVVANNITKYNNSADAVLPAKKASRRILVIDQTANDNSILLGQCETFQFGDMLQHALDQADAEVILKLHPETVAGAKGGNLTEINKHLDNDRLTLIDQQCNVMSVIKQVDEVYVMTSGVGFEAIMVGKPVRCFGVPFYAGWGLTTDMVPVKNPRRNLSVEALFAAVFFHYTVFFHPETKEECRMEECIDWVIANKPVLPAIKIGTH